MEKCFITIDIWREILMYLDNQSFLHVSLTCKRLYTLLKDNLSVYIKLHPPPVPIEIVRPRPYMVYSLPTKQAKKHKKYSIPYTASVIGSKQAIKEIKRNRKQQSKADNNKIIYPKR